MTTEISLVRIAGGSANFCWRVIDVKQPSPVIATVHARIGDITCLSKVLAIGFASECDGEIYASPSDFGL